MCGITDPADALDFDCALAAVREAAEARGLQDVAEDGDAQIMTLLFTLLTQRL
jgi:hypothetical protein